MKKIFLFFVFCFSSVMFCENINEKKLEENNASILYYHTKAEDYIVVKNKSRRTDVWNFFGHIEPTGAETRGYNFSLDNYLSGVENDDWIQLCKTSKIQSSKMMKFSTRWMDEIEYITQYAIYAESGTEYEYQLETHNNDLYIYIYDKGANIPNKHFEFSVGGKFTIIGIILTIVFYSIYIPLTLHFGA